MSKSNDFFYDEKTANVILVYQYSSIAEKKQSSRVISLTGSLTPQTLSVKDFVLSLGKANREVEPLDSREWQRTPAKGAQL
jgi:hypothetical protein